MPKKMPSVIEKFDLNTKPFSGVEVTPTFVNFFFGKNGAGKSTIAKAINANEGVTWMPGKSTDDYKIYLFDRDFIESNFKSYGNLKGVFTISKENIAVQEKITSKMAERDAVAESTRNSQEKKKELNASLAQLTKDYQQSFWKDSKKMREIFDRTQDGRKGSAAKFSEELLRQKPVGEYDFTELKSLYDVAYDDSSRTYNLFRNVDDSTAAYNPDALSLLAKAVISSGDTEFAGFMRAINATDWVKHGHDQYAGNADHRCPFCQQTLPDDFEKNITDCFDKQYDEDIRMLKTFQGDYAVTMRNVLSVLKANLEDTYPKADLSDYREKLARLESHIVINNQLIADKLASPAQAVELKCTESLFTELRGAIANINTAITPSEISQLNSFFAENSKIEKALLFGSRAMGLARSNSDVDIALVGDALTTRDVLRLASRLEESSLPYQFDLILYHSIQSDDLLRHIEQYGKVLYKSTVPVGWREVALGDVVTFLDKKRRPLSSLERQKRQGIYPYYGASGIIDYIDSYIFTDKLLLISEDGENLKTRKTDIAFFAQGKYWVNNHAHIVDGSRYLTKEYLNYYFKNIDISPFLTGAVQPKLSQDNLKKIQILIPPLETQQKIASILSALDDKIELNNKINKNLEDQAQALFKSWFVDFEPFGGVMPEGWKCQSVDSVTKISVGGDKPKYFSQQKTEEYSIPIFSNGITNDGLYGYTNNPIILNESVTISARGTIGFTCLRIEPYVPIVRLLVLEPKKEIITAKYLYFSLLNKHITGTGTTQQQLTAPYFRTTEILIADFVVISKFSKIVNSFFEKIWSNKKENETLAALRDTLLPKLLSGEIDVSHISLDTAEEQA